MSNELKENPEFQKLLTQVKLICMGATGGSVEETHRDFLFHEAGSMGVHNIVVAASRVWPGLEERWDMSDIVSFADVISLCSSLWNRGCRAKEIA